MRLRYVKGARDKIAAHPTLIHNDGHLERSPIDWPTLFPNAGELHLEIGTGKGQFLYELARRHPRINHLGIEKFDSAIVKALYKLLEEPLDNLRLLRADAMHLMDLIPPKSVSRIYLNFSDPWPKVRHEKRRLTHPSFLARYETLLKEHGDIHFKTDNRSLFEYSLETMRDYGMTIHSVSYDLHNEQSDIVTTEFEDRFRSEGKPIHHLIATFKEEQHG